MTPSDPTFDAAGGLGRIGYLGPDFTFSQRAAMAMARGDVLIDFGAIDNALDQLDAGRFEAVVLPIDSSAGLVLPTLDALTRYSGRLSVVAGHREPVRFGLYRRTADAAPLSRVFSHLMSFKQCADWLDGHTEASRTVVASNGAAFVAVRDGQEPGVAAIAPAGLTEAGMIEIATDLQGPRVNETCFLKIRPGSTEDAVVGALLLFDSEASAAELRKAMEVDGSKLTGDLRRTSDGRLVMEATFGAPQRSVGLEARPGVRVLLSTPVGL